MKKTKSSFILGVMLFMTILMFSSCDDDDYSLDDFYIDLATVSPIGDSKSFYLILDDKTTLIPVAPLNINYTPKANQRVYIDYTLLSDSYEDYDHAIKINYISNILTKDVSIINTDTQSDSLGYDPIQVKSVWFGDDYLNFRFAFRYNHKTHFVNLVENKLREYDDDGKIHLELRHNAYEDEQYKDGIGLGAFDIRPYIARYPEAESIGFVIHVQEEKGEEKIYERNYTKTNVDTSDTKSFWDTTTSLDLE
ncbi:NigD-like protein [Dysgonomonas sp. 520]|uniref:NigD-like protein n=1 Tax=Dysgonomonas sp. 520 TaxID=2302931 RepID=UPI0013D38ADB|nr:NigD-like protein [Dysgonomonas sp. 520]NDW09773.1 hypothetical protein [Dysgonomonas sp. 520]